MRISDWSSDVCSSDLAAARAVDDAHATLGLRERLRVDHAAGLVGHRHMQGDDVGACQQGVQLHLLDVEVARAVRRQEGVVGDDVHLQRSEEHTSELQSLMRISYAVFCLKKKKTKY